MHRTCEPSKCSTDIAWWCWCAKIQQIFCDWVFSLHAFSTVISHVIAFTVVSIDATILWLLCALHHALENAHFFLLQKLRNKLFCMCTFSVFMIWNKWREHWCLDWMEQDTRWWKWWIPNLHHIPFFHNNNKYTCDVYDGTIAYVIYTDERTTNSINFKIIQIFSRLLKKVKSSP